MCKVSELIEYLQKLDPDTEVEVVERYDLHYGTSTRYVPLDLGEYSETLCFADYTDSTGALAGRKLLFLGDD
jgi:hypothetical protein